MTITAKMVATAAKTSTCLDRFGSTTELYDLPELPVEPGIYYVEPVFDHPDPDDSDYEKLVGFRWAESKKDFLPRTSGGTPESESQVFIDVFPDVVHFVVGAGTHGCELWVTETGWFCRGDYLPSERCWGTAPRHEIGIFRQEDL